MIRILIPALLLAGCATTAPERPEPVVITKEVVVPGPPTPCVPKSIGGRPTYPDTDTALKAASGPDERYQLLAAGRPLREARLREIEPVIASCPKEK